jgi:NADPH2:quinone reductase
MLAPKDFYGYCTELFELVRSGKLHVEIYKEYPFTTKGIRQTHIDIEGRGTSGKLLVKIGS